MRHVTADGDDDRADDLDISQKLASILYLRVQVTAVITEPSGMAISFLHVIQ